MFIMVDISCFVSGLMFDEAYWYSHSIKSFDPVHFTPQSTISSGIMLLIEHILTSHLACDFKRTVLSP